MLVPLVFTLHMKCQPYYWLLLKNLVSWLMTAWSGFSTCLSAGLLAMLLHTVHMHNNNCTIIIVDHSLVPRPILARSTRVYWLAAVSWALGTRSDTGAFLQSSDLIDQYGCVSDWSLYSWQWRFYILALGESYCMFGLRPGKKILVSQARPHQFLAAGPFFN